MAWTQVILKNPLHEGAKQAPVGFSWTTLFFGILPALFRGDWKWFIIQTIFALITWGLSSIFFAFVYNKLYLKTLLEQGYFSDQSDNVLEPVETSLSLKITRRK